MDEEQLGENSFLENIYKIYQKDPESLDPSWKVFFNSLEGENSQNHHLKRPLEEQNSKNETERIQHLIDIYRRFGHLMSRVNAIEIKEKEEPLQLNLEWIGFSSDELENLFPTLRLLPEPYAPLKEIIQTLRTIYCGKIGYEFKETSLELEEWIQERIESREFQKELSSEEKKLILNQLNRAELLENFLHVKYVGQKRFSLEGAETLIPMLILMLEKGGEEKLAEVIIGMAHRGRINVLANILNKPYDLILSEFDENHIPDPSEGLGDVKYHKGYQGEYTTSQGKKIVVSLPPNPSHLESIYPVVEGQVRARQLLTKDESSRSQTIPILIHGDAAIAGQGVIYETLQFSQLNGYETGGTLHIIINNQIGFTTIPRDSRSTHYCSSIARTFNIPVFHVNAEDPEGSVHVMLLALEIRQKFHCDVFIDLNCYRKYGHNEGDEPAFTQPLEYQIIRNKKPIRRVYCENLVKEGVIENEAVTLMEKEIKEILLRAHAQAYTEDQASRRGAENGEDSNDSSRSSKNHLSLELLQEITEQFCHIPSNFNIHPKVGSLVKERLSAVKEDRPINWGLAEHLAFATLLWEGTSVRLSGQDVGRGTFSQRHSLWVDQVVERDYYPLCHLKENQGHFSVYNSSLSEMGVLGFEYGYSVISPNSLTIWEAQYGDFSNGAQIIIDQYLSSGEEKWGQKSNLVLFLPHGYEGQGPEHSSARLERFLSLKSNDNMTIANLTTPVQLFHLLRRQIHEHILKPLIIFTPKALLRLPDCSSQIEEFVSGEFQTILDDSQKQQKVERLIFCSGHIYFDLIAKRQKEKLEGFVIIRIEQLNPLDEQKLKELITSYAEAKECFWVQEEPQNMGAWSYISTYLNNHLPANMRLKYIGRKVSATPATGSRFYHEQEQANLLKEVFHR